VEPPLNLEQRIVVFYRKDREMDGAMQTLVETARAVFPGQPE
jgi:hypothetical protein